MIGQFYNDDSRRPIGSGGSQRTKNVRARRGRESYPQFLPWCDRAVVSVSEPGRTLPHCAINFRGLKKEFTTENLNRPGTSHRHDADVGTLPQAGGKLGVHRSYRHGLQGGIEPALPVRGTLLEKLAGPAFQDINGHLRRCVRSPRRREIRRRMSSPKIAVEIVYALSRPAGAAPDPASGREHRRGCDFAERPARGVSGNGHDARRIHGEPVPLTRSCATGTA